MNPESSGGESGGAESSGFESGGFESSRRSGRKEQKKTKVKRFGMTSYVASVGTCQVCDLTFFVLFSVFCLKGDSGGPSFVEETPGRFIVTGVQCGKRLNAFRISWINIVYQRNR